MMVAKSGWQLSTAIASLLIVYSVSAIAAELGASNDHPHRLVARGTPNRETNSPSKSDSENTETSVEHAHSGAIGGTDGHVLFHEPSMNVMLGSAVRDDKSPTPGTPHRFNSLVSSSSEGGSRTKSDEFLPTLKAELESPEPRKSRVHLESFGSTNRPKITSLTDSLRNMHLNGEQSLSNKDQPVVTPFKRHPSLEFFDADEHGAGIASSGSTTPRPSGKSAGSGGWQAMRLGTPRTPLKSRYKRHTVKNTPTLSPETPRVNLLSGIGTSRAHGQFIFGEPHETTPPQQPSVHFAESREQTPRQDLASNQATPQKRFPASTDAVWKAAMEQRERERRENHGSALTSYDTSGRSTPAEGHTLTPALQREFDLRQAYNAKKPKRIKELAHMKALGHENNIKRILRKGIFQMGIKGPVRARTGIHGSNTERNPHLTLDELTPDGKHSKAWHFVVDKKRRPDGNVVTSPRSGREEWELVDHDPGNKSFDKQKVTQPWYGGRQPGDRGLRDQWTGVSQTGDRTLLKNALSSSKDYRREERQRLRNPGETPAHTRVPTADQTPQQTPLRRNRSMPQSRQSPDVAAQTSPQTAARRIGSAPQPRSSATQTPLRRTGSAPHSRHTSNQGAGHGAGRSPLKRTHSTH